MSQPLTGDQCRPERPRGIMAAPVSGPPTRTSNSRTKPMPKPPTRGASGDIAVPKTANIRKKVSTASMPIAWLRVTLLAMTGSPSRAGADRCGRQEPLDQERPHCRSSQLGQDVGGCRWQRDPPG